MDRFIGRLLMPWVRFNLRPPDVARQFEAGTLPVCYVLARESALDELVLQRACARARLPRPRRRLLASGVRVADRALLPLARKTGFWRGRMDRRAPAALTSLIEAVRRDAAFDVLLVPVSVYWGRAPQRESGSWLRLLVSEDWGLASRIRRLATVLLNGRNTLVEFGGGVSLRQLLADDVPAGIAARRISRQLLAQLAAARTAYIGPDLSHRRTLMAQVLRARPVRALVAQQARERGIARRKALEEAQAIFEEIAADYSPRFVQLMERVLKWLWTRIFDGVEVQHTETLGAVAAGNELVYVPCHRSTMDDVLTPYAVYTRGFAVPHIAAGINLNLPLIGPLLRKGGAIFMRRSFRGSPLYTAVFMNYLGAIMARGHPIQYFIEGGRSRTGRLLAPKTGMLSMTLRSYLRQPRRPVVFVPVYLGYERIMEVDSYVGELSGQPKEKETLGGFLKSLKRLRENFGRVHVNIGEPIPLTQLLDATESDWRSQIGQEVRAADVKRAVDELAPRIMRHINSAAVMTPVNLLALVLLATPRQVMLEADLLRQLDFCLRLLRQAPYSERMTVTPLSPLEILGAGEKLQIVERRAGGMVGVAPRHAASMAYYRNNVLHLLAIPSLLACCFLSNEALEEGDLQRLAWRIYPYIASELFLRWEESDVEQVVAQYLAALDATGVLRVDESRRWRAAHPATAEAMQLSLLAQPTLQTIERYYLAIELLRQAGSGVLTQAELGKRCQQMAERMLTLYGFHSPEFHDRALFDGYLGLLRRRGVIRADGEGRLMFDDVLERIASDAQLVLSEQIRHSVLQVVHG
ncbi:MAG: glycerol-3-phosphate 1-O-acyltransferase PlsB [Steroidobacteraceae bacterium]